MNPDLGAAPRSLRYLCLSGSRAHGTATETSDWDWRGVYQAETTAFLGLHQPLRTWEGAGDVVLWELGHFIHLLLKGNPNLIGMLWSPPDCISTTSGVIARLFEERQRFLTRSMGYAYWGWVQRELKAAHAAALPPKRLGHIPRLLWELDGAITNGEVPVRLAGDHLEFVLDVRSGKRGLDDVMGLVNSYGDALEKAIDRLPPAPTEWADALLIETRLAVL